MNLNLQRKFQIAEPEQFTLSSLKNENTNLIFIEKLKQFSSNHKYPDVLSAYKTLSNVTKIPTSNIIFGYGSDSLLKDLTLMLDYNSIQIMKHSYEMSLFYNSLFEKEIVVNDWVYNTNFTPQINIENISTEALYLVSPHCPTGVEFSYEQIKLYTQKFKYVILDQAYTNPLEFDLRFLELDNLIVIKTFSKLGGVPGMRLGYCVASKIVINTLALVKNLYEMTTNGWEYLNFICNNSYIINESIEDLKQCREEFTLKYKQIHSAGNFVTIPNCFDLEGKSYVIDNKPFLRITIPYSNPAPIAIHISDTAWFPTVS